MMKKNGWLKYLIYYYGTIQVVHWLANAYVIFVDRVGVFGALSGSLVAAQIQVLMFSSYIDFFIASPLGVWFAWNYLKRKRRMSIAGDISLNFAMASAWFYVYVLNLFDALEITALNVFIFVAFVPVGWLYVMYVRGGLRKA